MSEIPPSASAVPPRRRLSVSSILNPAIETRIDEQQRGTFSRHAIETVCFDLRLRRNHSVTGDFAWEPPEIQDAIDRFIIHYYRPGMERNGGTLRALIFGDLSLPVRQRRRRSPACVKIRRDVFFPPLLAGIIEDRWRDLGFPSISDYVASVMRYDLLLCGQHVYFRGDDCTPEMLAALDRETLAEYEADRNPKIKLDYLLEEAARKKLTRIECEMLLRDLGRKIRELAVEYFL